MLKAALMAGLAAGAAGCVALDEDIDRVHRAVATWTVTWTQTVGVSGSGTGDSLFKTDPLSKWNAGAFSDDLLQITQGYVEFTTSENDTAKMLGLTADVTIPGDPSGTGYTNMDFAIRLKQNGRVAVFENGTLRGDNLTPYVPGDLFRIENLGGVVTYAKNGSIFYTSTATPNPDVPLRVDTAFYTPGATINDAVLVSTELISWQNAVKVSVFMDELRNAGVTNGWKAGASSIDTIDGDGYVEFYADDDDDAKMAGLSNGDENAGYQDIDFAIRLKRNGTVAVFEKGVLRGDNLMGYQPGQLFRVEVTGGVVTYSKEGVVFYTSTQEPTFPLRVDTSFYSTGARLEGFRVVQL